MAVGVGKGRPGRPPRGVRRLWVDLYGERIAEVRVTSGNRFSLSYLNHRSLLESGFPPLSLSMPLTAETHGHKAINAFMWGLLPENPAVLDALARDHHVSPANPLSLLSIVGEDCAGAVQFVTDDAAPIEDGVIELTDAEVGQRLRDLRLQTGSMGRRSGDLGQFSLGGAQSKTALMRLADGRWGVPRGRMPTTHILKPPMPELDGQVENEHFCLQLCKALGIAAARSRVERFGIETCIAVERYDRVGRQQDDGSTLWVRLHQEDFCQASAVMPRNKYQQDGGPNARRLMTMLRDHSTEPEADMRRLAMSLAMNFILLSTDAHAKNFSILMARAKAGGDGRPRMRLSPLYDVNSYLPYVDERPGDIRLAMSVGTYYSNGSIMPRHWERESRSWGATGTNVLGEIRSMLARAPDLASDVAARCREQGLEHAMIPRLATLIAERCAKLAPVYGTEP